MCGFARPCVVERAGLFLVLRLGPDYVLFFSESEGGISLVYYSL